MYYNFTINNIIQYISILFYQLIPIIKIEINKMKIMLKYIYRFFERYIQI